MRNESKQTYLVFVSRAVSLTSKAKDININKYK